MKAGILGFTLTCLLAGSALAGEKENAIRHIAQVMATTHLCPKVEMNSTAMTLIAAGYGVDLSRDADAIRAIAREQMAAWQGKDADAACVAGMMLYGPDGQNIPGLLSWN